MEAGVNWKRLSEEKPINGSFVIIDTGDNIHLGWVIDQEMSGFEYWAYVERHDGSMPSNPYTEAGGIKFFGDKTSN